MTDQRQEQPANTRWARPLVTEIRPSATLVLKIRQIEQDCASRQISRRALCAALDIAPSTWTRWKAGRNSPTLSTWARVEQEAAVFLKRADISVGKTEEAVA